MSDDFLFDKIDEALSNVLNGQKGSDVFNSLTLYYGSSIVSLFNIKSEKTYDFIKELDKTIITLIEKYRMTTRNE